MNSIGEALRAERVRRHLDIQGISRELKIPAKFLEAIEREQFDKLPAAVFARSFVRQYARYLGLQEDDFVLSLQNVLEPAATFAESAGERLDAPSIQVERMAEWESVGERRSWSSSLPALALVVVAMLACSGVYAWWQRNRHAVSAHEQNAATGQETTATLAGRPAPPPVSASQGGTPSVSGAQAVGKPATPNPPATNPPAANPAMANPAMANPAGAEALRIAGGSEAPAATPGPVHVQVTASALVWVMAKADDKTSFTGTLQPSQSRVVDAQHMVVLRLGNAAGAEITLNGKSIGPVGPSGQPRTIQLTSGGFQIVAPPKPPDLDPLL
jgi:cytoskeleton protein RodZ